MAYRHTKLSAMISLDREEARAHLLRVAKATGSNKTLAAEVLGLAVSTLNGYLDRLDIRDEWAMAKLDAPDLPTNMTTIYRDWLATAAMIAEHTGELVEPGGLRDAVGLALFKWEE